MKLLTLLLSYIFKFQLLNMQLLNNSLNMKSKIILITLLCPLTFLLAQKPIKLKNPSFEDVPNAGTVPTYWLDCGSTDQTPPDIQPNPAFGPQQSAYHGETYVGMVVRDIGNTESIAQKLSESLKPDSCYKFSIYLARSNAYMSGSRKTDRVVNYNEPVILQIWSSSWNCSHKELLAISAPIENTEWASFTIKLKPKKEVKYLELIAFYSKIEYYNGNILLDNISDIVPCKCEE
jgi:hypothetical protein